MKHFALAGHAALALIAVSAHAAGKKKAPKTPPAATAPASPPARTLTNYYFTNSHEVTIDSAAAPV
jgi:hypothetical protein